MAMCFITPPFLPALLAVLLAVITTTHAFSYLSFLQVVAAAYKRRGSHRRNGICSLPNPDNTEQEEEYRSVSDYVGGLHGGKYVFDPRISGVTALNYEKSVVFGDVIESNRPSSSNSLQQLAAAPENATPDWAQRSLEYERHVIGDVVVFRTDMEATQVRLVNDELSWEPFYASIETAVAANEVIRSVRVSPWNGTLAPRGGRNEYTDQCCLSVTMDGTASSADLLWLEAQQVYLVARTECEAWVWRLKIQQ